jgi:hypothetical protein
VLENEKGNYLASKFGGKVGFAAPRGRDPYAAQRGLQAAKQRYLVTARGAHFMGRELNENHTMAGLHQLMMEIDAATSGLPEDQASEAALGVFLKSQYGTSGFGDVADPEFRKLQGDNLANLMSSWKAYKAAANDFDVYYQTGVAKATGETPRNLSNSYDSILRIQDVNVAVLAPREEVGWQAWQRNEGLLQDKLYEIQRITDTAEGESMANAAQALTQVRTRTGSEAWARLKNESRIQAAVANNALGLQSMFGTWEEITDPEAGSLQRGLGLYLWQALRAGHGPALGYDDPNYVQAMINGIDNSAMAGIRKTGYHSDDLQKVYKSAAELEEISPENLEILNELVETLKDIQ